MALIKCPECQKEISDVAKTCPNCGYELKTAVNGNISKSRGATKEAWLGDKNISSEAMEKRKKINKKILKFGCFPILLLFIFVIIVINIPESEDNEVMVKNQETLEANKSDIPVINENSNIENAVDFILMEKEDISMKALGEKKLSDYSSSELEALPQNKRMSYRVVVPPTIKDMQVLPTFQKVLNEIISSDNEIDQIVIFMYSDKEVINGAYDVAKAEWAPNGEWGTVTPEIARNNDRTSYQIKLQIRDDLENYLENRNKSEIKFGFSDTQRKQIFIELVGAEDRAMKDADEKFPIVATGTMDDLKKYANYNNERLEIYEAEIREKYGLTEEQESELSLEGLVKNWPLE